MIEKIRIPNKKFIFEKLDLTNHELSLGPNDLLVMARIADSRQKLTSVSPTPLLLGTIRDVSNLTLRNLQKQRQAQLDEIDKIVNGHTITLRPLEMYCLDKNTEPFLYRSNAYEYFQSTAVVMSMVGGNTDRNFTERKAHQDDVDNIGKGTKGFKYSVFGTLGYLLVLPVKNPSKSQLVFAQPNYDMMSREGEEELSFFVIDESGTDQNVITSISCVPNDSHPGSNLAVLNTSTVKLIKRNFKIIPKKPNSST